MVSSLTGRMGRGTLDPVEQILDFLGWFDGDSVGHFTFAVTFGARIQKLRLKRGWLTRKAADRATNGDVPEDTWKNIETKGTDPRLSTIQRFADALEISMDELLEDVDGPGPADKKPRHRAVED